MKKKNISSYNDMVQNWYRLRTHCQTPTTLQQQLIIKGNVYSIHNFFYKKCIEKIGKKVINWYIYLVIKINRWLHKQN